MSKRAYEQREREGKPLQEILKDDQRSYSGSELFMTNFKLMSEAQAAQCPGIMEVVQRLSSREHFSIMILRDVKPKVMNSIRADQLGGGSTAASAIQADQVRADTLVDQLANTYAFMMAPEKYEELWQETAVTATQQSASSATHKPIEIFVSIDKQLTPEGRKDGTDESTQLSSRLCADGCYMGAFLDTAAARAPDPKTDMKMILDGEYKQEDDYAETSVLKVKGVLAYFPFEDDAETVPNWSDGDVEEDRGMVLCFWEKRLVRLGLGRIVALYYSSSTSYQIP